MSLCALHRQRRKLRGYAYARTSCGGRSIEVVFMRIASAKEELRGYARTSGGGRSIEVVFMRVASAKEELRGYAYACAIDRGGREKR